MLRVGALASLGAVVRRAAQGILCGGSIAASTMLLLLSACGSDPGGEGATDSQSDAGVVERDATTDASEVEQDATSDARCPGAICGSSCVDLQSDIRHCGGCDVDCSALPNVADVATTCVAGKCNVATACEPTFADCNGDATDGCETDLSTAAHCGACGIACVEPTAFCAMDADGGDAFGCSSGCSGDTPDRCDAMCVNKMKDVANCGTCENACTAPADGTAVCENGICGFTCSTGFHACGTACADDTSVMSCGASCDPCPSVANATATCGVDGQCHYACDASSFDCRGTCIGIAASNCNDGNDANGDGCSAACVRETGWTCSGSPSVCAPICGDGLRLGSEECDDGNMFSNGSGHTSDGCTYPDCTVTPGFYCQPRTGMPDLCLHTCGNGVQDGTEACDDGNAIANDGCTSCAIDPGYSCSATFPSACAPVCGDGIKAGGTKAEQCDDANTRSEDGCSSLCALEGAGWSCPVVGTRNVCSITYSGAGFAVTDLATTGTDLSFAPAGCVIAKVTATHTWSVRHTYASDVAMTLSHGGSSSLLFSHVGGTNDLSGPYTFTDSGPSTFPILTDPIQTGSYFPSTPLDVFNGTNANGTWSLRATDSAGGDTGTVGSWSVTVTCE